MSGEFLVDINPNIELPDYKLVLCKLNEEPLMELENVYGKTLDAFYINIDEFSFRVPKYIMDNGEQIENYIYNHVDGDYLILLNDAQYFYINNIKETSDDNGIEYKDVHCYSREFLLVNKKVRGYKADSKKLYDYNNTKDENGLEIGVMNYVERVSSWKVGYINANLLEKYRGFDIVDGNLLSFFQEIQKAFGCIFQFDTMTKTINIYEQNQLGQNKGLFITNENYIKSLVKTKDNESVRTRLYLYGKDGISIQSINITGQPYIENYDYYKNLKYMGQDLIDALNNYEVLVESKQGQFEGYLQQLETLNAQLGTKNDELVQLEAELKVLVQNYDNSLGGIIILGHDNAYWKAQMNLKNSEVTNKKSEIGGINTQINAVYNNINTLRNEIKLENNFTPELLGEFDDFIKDDTFSDNAYTEDNLYELLEEGKKTLAKVSQPPIDFDISVVDFLNLVECQHDWDKLVRGDIINVVHSGLGIDTEVRLIGYTHDKDSNSLNLKFSNRDNIYDSYMYELDLIDKIKTTSTTVDFSRFKWDKAEEVDSQFRQYLNSQLNLSNQAILKASGQKPILDDRGLWLYKMNADGTMNPEQIRAINNIIAVTKDNWNTVDVAITPDGVLANKIIGDIILGSNLKILGDNGILEILGNLLTIKDNQDKTRVLMGEYEVGKYGTKFPHEDGSYTTVDKDGIQRFVAGTGREYFYLSHMGVGKTLDKPTGNQLRPFDIPDNVTIQLPDEFKNKKFNIQVSPRNIGYDQNVNVQNWGIAGVILATTDIDYINAKFTVKAHVTFSWPQLFYPVSGDPYLIWANSPRGLEFNYIAMA